MIVTVIIVISLKFALQNNLMKLVITIPNVTKDRNAFLPLYTKIQVLVRIGLNLMVLAQMKIMTYAYREWLVLVIL